MSRLDEQPPPLDLCNLSDDDDEDANEDQMSLTKFVSRHKLRHTAKQCHRQQSKDVSDDEGENKSCTFKAVANYLNDFIVNKVAMYM